MALAESEVEVGFAYYEPEIAVAVQVFETVALTDIGCLVPILEFLLVAVQIALEESFVEKQLMMD